MASKVCKSADPEDQVCDEHDCSLTCHGKSCLQTCSGSNCSLKCDARGCTQNCSSKECTVECKAVYCVQTCSSSKCSLKCLAAQCSQNCSSGECTLECDGRTNQKCNQICHANSCIKKTVANSATSTMKSATTEAFKTASKHYHTRGHSLLGEYR